MNPWYLVKSKPCQEDRAKHFLSLMGVEVFLPMTQEIKAHPFFPGYLFARFPLELFVKVGNAFGVRTVVKFGGMPAFVPEWIIEDLRSMKQIAAAVVSTPKFQRGDEVAITDGPWKGRYGIFDHAISGKERVEILISTLTPDSQGFHQQVRGANYRVEVGRFDLMHA